MVEYKVVYNKRIPPQASSKKGADKYDFREPVSRVIRGECKNAVFVAADNVMADRLRHALRRWLERTALPVSLTMRGRYLFVTPDEKKRRAMQAPGGKEKEEL